MSLTPRLRAPLALGRTALRCFSSTPAPQNSSAALIDILGSSSAKPSASSSLVNPSTSASNPATRFAVNAGLAERTALTREMVESERRAQFQRQIFRRWAKGDIYAPHDLTGVEQKKWKFGRKTPQSDALDVLGINAVNEYKNFTMMSEYMTEMGRIKHSKDTGLRPKNQRKIAKAIRRAIGLGLMSSVHRHPLVLKSARPTLFT